MDSEWKKNAQLENIHFLNRVQYGKPNGNFLTLDFFVIRLAKRKEKRRISNLSTRQS
jgi:hypothetical protein